MEQSPDNQSNLNQPSETPPPQTPQLTWESVMNEQIASTRGWLMFLGVFHIVMAALYTLATIGFGVIVAWVPFLMGLFLINAATRAKSYLATGAQSDMALYHKQLKNFFLTSGIMMIVSTALMIIAIAVALSVGFNIKDVETIKSFDF